MIPIILSATLLLAAGDTTAYQIFPYRAESENASLYLLPGVTSDAANIVILDDTELTVYPSTATRPSIQHTISPDTLLFDLYDSNDDGLPELFTLLPDALLHFPKANNQSSVQLFPIEPQLPWEVDQPFLHPIILSYDNSRLAAIPYQNNITLKNFDGKTISTLPKILSDSHSIFTIPVKTNPLGSKDAFEFKVDSVLTTAINIPSELRPAPANPDLDSPTPQRLREAEQREPDQWPTFPLSNDPENSERVIFASSAPEHVHTIIRIRRERPRSDIVQADPISYTPERIYPGSLTLSPSGFPDFNADGFHDLVLWRMEIPGRSLSTLTSNLQAQTWPIELTVHLYDPEKRLYAARPTARIKTKVSIQFIVVRQNQSPLRNLSFADINGDGRSDITLSPDPNTLTTWTYDNGFSREPEYRSTFENPISIITSNRQDTRTSSGTLLLRGRSTIYRLSVPESN